MLDTAPATGLARRPPARVIGGGGALDHCAAGWTIQPVTESVVSYGAENPRLPVAPEKEPVAVVTERPI